MVCTLHRAQYVKVFISWSGSRSLAAAELLSDWIKCVLQATRPWLSTRDIDRGALWFSEISDQLKDTTVGVVCLTQENKNKPWILFESGALAKGLSSNRVCTFLVDLKPTDVEDPLAQFNHTRPDREGLRRLVKTLNSSLATSSLDERILDQVFETYWPKFEEGFKELLKLHPAHEKTEPRSEKNLLAEILENTRFLSQRVRGLEARIEREVEPIEVRHERASMVSIVRMKKVLEKALTSGMSEEQIMLEARENGISPAMARDILFSARRRPQADSAKES